MYCLFIASFPCRADKDHSKDRTRDDSKDKTKDKSKERRVKRSGSKEREVEASLTSKSHQSLKDSSQPEPRPTHRVNKTIVSLGKCVRLFQLP